LEFLKYWPSSRDFNKLVIKVKMHAKYFLNFSFDVWRYNFYFYFWETWSYAWKQNILFLYFYIFLWKPSILIPDMYLYTIKIQINIDQNAVKYTRKSQILFWKYFLNLLIFFWGWVQLGLCGWARPSSPIRVTGPTQWPGCLRPACVNYSCMQCTVRR